MPHYSNECKLLVQRLRECNLKEVKKNPSLMIAYYPIRNPDNEATVFDEVYCIVNEDLLKKTYKFRVFYFLNIFLSSTKVPAHVIAAYLKRLSRICLSAQPRSLVAILRIIHNLFMRHPRLLVLRDRVDQKARELEMASGTCTMRVWLEDDPFDPKQVKDLAATNALESCVWEVMILRFHEHPRVAKEAQFLGETTVPEMERDLDDLLK